MNFFLFPKVRCFVIIIVLVIVILNLKSQILLYSNIKLNDKKIEKEEKTIIMLIRNPVNHSAYYLDAELQCKGPYIVKNRKSVKKYSDSVWNLGNLCLRDDESIYFYAIDSVKSQCMIGGKAFCGNIKVTKRKQGYLILNQLSLEKYLAGVVPSEMPSSYPMEALKAQAVCARTYALYCMREKRLKEFSADVDNTTNFQVYDMEKENEKTNSAVENTKNKIMVMKNQSILAEYYSTSCGLNKNTHIIDRKIERNLSDENAFQKYMNEGDQTDFEYNEAWYRWSCKNKRLDLSDFWNRIMESYTRNPNAFKTYPIKEALKKKTSIENIKNITIHIRENSGIIKQLIIDGEKYSISVESEYEIRYILASGIDQIERQDESAIDSMELLPSAYFYIVPRIQKGILTGYAIFGGGYGHGRGMSQNAAKNMALKQWNYEKILNYFYNGMELQAIE